MKTVLTFLLFICILGCSPDAVEPDLEDNGETTENADPGPSDPPRENPDPPTAPPTTPSGTALSALRTYIFGHSLVVHDPPAIPTPSNETTVPHWMASLAQAADLEFEVAGQYGFLPQHDNLPPISQWGFDLAAPAWESDRETFAEANFNSVLLTAANFIQYQPATENYYNEAISPIQATLSIFDWAREQQPDMALYIYENWPDMAPFLDNGSFPPTAQQLASYHAHTQNEFHAWWLDYHDALMAARPEMQIKMIPVGPIMAKILTQEPFNAIATTTLYEDDAPHGRPTLYFMAGLITYMAMYATNVPADYEVPNTVDPIVANNIMLLGQLIAQDLEAFQNQDGSSRVYPEP
ncbi:hypothetical protein [Maribacter sp. 2307ULW6-5]|uniref:hypothetical protein n=1 Tax=Maribacter sp. 2307ULW6-5 TaxID=3386275 RepID=UPI0039BCC3E3